jgi:hypothetical protein
MGGLDLTIKILLGGGVVSTLPQLLAWTVGDYVFRINATVLMGVVAGARVNTAPVKEAINDLNSSVPWVHLLMPGSVASRVTRPPISRDASASITS